MAKKIKEHKDLVCIFGVGIILAVGGILIMSGMIVLPNSASAATETVQVTATVEEYLTFTVSPTSTSLSPSLVDTAGGTHIGSSTDISVTVSTNWGSYSITASSSNAGLNNATASADTLIETVNTTSTLTEADDDDGYGLQATSAVATIQANYDYWGTETVGELPSATAPQIIQDSGTPATNRQSTLKIKAECDSAQEPGDYIDTILLTCTGAVS